MVGGVLGKRGYVNQISAIKIIVEKYLEKSRKLSAASTDLEQAYGQVEKKGFPEDILCR